MCVCVCACVWLSHTHIPSSSSFSSFSPSLPLLSLLPLSYPPLSPAAAGDDESVPAMDESLSCDATDPPSLHASLRAAPGALVVFVVVAVSALGVLALAAASARLLWREVARLCS